MEITLSIPDIVARRFQTAIPARERSRFVTRLIEQELCPYRQGFEQNDRETIRSSPRAAPNSNTGEQGDCLTAACHAANRDEALQREIDEWQLFDDGFEE